MTAALHMRWTDLAFLHWPVAYDAIRPMVPIAFELGTFEGAAWVGITPFRMTGVRPRWGPPVPTTSDFPELNVRTYVRFRERPGVYFFSLDAASRLAVMVARIATNLPYRYARMTQTRDGDDVVYTSTRRESSAPSAEFRARYRATGLATQSAPGSFEYWATERYSLFTIAGDSVLRLDIEHEPWALQPASVDIDRNTMARAAGIDLPDAPPRAHFSRSLEVVAHFPSRQRAR